MAGFRTYNKGNTIKLRGNITKNNIKKTPLHSEQLAKSTAYTWEGDERTGKCQTQPTSYSTPAYTPLGAHWAPFSD